MQLSQENAVIVMEPDPHMWKWVWRFQD